MKSAKRLRIWPAPPSHLGSVGIQDSHPGLVVIQAVDGPIRFDCRPMGEDGAALSRQAERSRPQRQGQPTFCRGRAVDCPNRQPMAGSAGLIRPLEQRFTRFRDLVKADIWKRLFDAVKRK